MKPRVLLGMSGGVDSSVAAALLLRAGYDVIGVTMKMWPQDCLDRQQDKSCGPFAMVDARAVAEQLGFPHYVVDEQAHFQKIVIDYFVAEYRAGRTPNPCVLCNERVKFGALLDKANALGADFIATGHYARVARASKWASQRVGESAKQQKEICSESPEGATDKSLGRSPGLTEKKEEKPCRGGRTLLLRSREPQKDQTYFLFSLKQDQLARCLFPLGDMTKAQVRALATELGLKTAAKEDSQEICFVPEHDYRRFLREDGKLTPQEGEIVTRDGQILGRHAGIEYFTIGQRKGLGISAPQPYYVVALEAQTNRVIVGNPEELMTKEFYVERPNWIAFDSLASSSFSSSKLTVKIRSQHAGAPCTIEVAGDHRVRVTLAAPERAITPGQAAVFYDGDLVLGGGWIASLAECMEVQRIAVKGERT